MNRDLVFFVSGVAFGVVAGYFVFRSVLPAESSAPSPSSPAPVESSTIGLDEEPQFEPLDEAEVARLEKMAAESTEDAELHARIGKLYLDAGRFDDALGWLERAVELAPRGLPPRNHLALTYLNVGRLEDAVATYEGSLGVDPNHPPSLLGLGRIKLYVEQDIEGGLSMWQKLIEVAPDSTEAMGVRDELEALRSAHSRG